MYSEKSKILWMESALGIGFESLIGVDAISKNDIHVLLNNENRINGRAYKKGEKYYIEISSITFDALFRFYDILLQEKNHKFGLYTIFNNFSNNFNEELSIKYRDILFTMSLYFLFFHEFGHIIHGHIDYINSEIDQDFYGFSEFFDKENINFYKIENQMLEIDADSFSANLSTLFIFFDHNLNILKINKNQALLMLVYSIQTIFAFLGLGEARNRGDLIGFKYIPPRLRLDDIIDVIYTVLGKYKLSDGIISKSEIKKMLYELESYYYGYMNSHNSYNGESELNNLFELDEEHKEHRLNLEIYWEFTLKNKLKKYSYFKLAELGDYLK